MVGLDHVCELLSMAIDDQKLGNIGSPGKGLEQLSDESDWIAAPNRQLMVNHQRPRGICQLAKVSDSHFSVREG